MSSKRRTYKSVMMELQDYKCFYCGINLKTDSRSRGGSTVDHLIPKCDFGGSESPLNTVIACRVCNEEKGSNPPEHIHFVKLSNIFKNLSESILKQEKDYYEN